MNNPTTGEWTTKYVHELMNGIGADSRIADEHNAALAAEREKVQTLRDALKQLQKRNLIREHMSIVNAALAKAKEGKQLSDQT
jgi:hypothetical protein